MTDRTTALPATIPLFPLPDVVLFPLMPLPLHIFEPRYRHMVREALEGPRMIGMVLLRPGWENDYYGRPAIYPVGCAGRIEQDQALPDGRYNILLKGLTRFRVREERPGGSYRLAEVDPAPEGPDQPNDLDAARRRLQEASRESDPVLLVSAPSVLPHEAFLNALCHSLSLSAAEKQSLLECDYLLERYTRLTQILDFHRLERTFGTRASTTH